MRRFGMNERQAEKELNLECPEDSSKDSRIKRALAVEPEVLLLMDENYSTFRACA